jgi:hypothetical protein
MYAVSSKSLDVVAREYCRGYVRVIVSTLRVFAWLKS